MIYTITLNPSIDYVMFTEQFDLGGLNRAAATHKFAGGKGINVSRVLKALQKPSTALGYIGGFPGQFIQTKLEQTGIATKFIQVDEDTRINVKLKGHTETEINAQGPLITTHQVNELLEQIKSLTSNDFVIIAGSIPKSMPEDIYETIASECAANNVPFVVDAEKSLLLQTLKHHPQFVKPNKVELEEMFDVSIHSDQDIIDAAQQLMSLGAKNVLVSLGGDGAMLVTPEISYKAQVPSGKVINTVGSGDSTVAGMVAGLDSNLSTEESFKQAVSCGTATAFTEDLATNEQIQVIMNKVNITKLEV